MGRLIDAIALQEEYKRQHNGKRLLLIDVAPTVDAVPVKHGRWMLGVSLWYCSECGSSYSYNDYAYCPHCGAKMCGKEDGDGNG